MKGFLEIWVKKRRITITAAGCNYLYRNIWFGQKFFCVIHTKFYQVGNRRNPIVIFKFSDKIIFIHMSNSRNVVKWNIFRKIIFYVWKYFVDFWFYAAFIWTKTQICICNNQVKKLIYKRNCFWVIIYINFIDWYKLLKYTYIIFIMHRVKYRWQDAPYFWFELLLQLRSGISWVIIRIWTVGKIQCQLITVEIPFRTNSLPRFPYYKTSFSDFIMIVIQPHFSVASNTKIEFIIHYISYIWTR